MLKPEDIDKKRFTVRRWRGYDLGEVDDFLDCVLDAYRDALGRLDRALTENELLRKQPTQTLPPVINDTVNLLNVAQQTHDKVITDANTQAGRIISAAESQATEIVLSGQERRRLMISQLEQERDELQEQVTDLQKTTDAIRTSMKMALESIGDETR